MVANARPKLKYDFFLKVWDREKLTVPLAKALLNLKFSEEETERVSKLRTKNTAGSISAEEHAELDAYVQASLMIGILQSRARGFLKAKRPKTDNA